MTAARVIVTTDTASFTVAAVEERERATDQTVQAPTRRRCRRRRCSAQRCDGRSRQQQREHRSPELNLQACLGSEERSTFSN